VSQIRRRKNKKVYAFDTEDDSCGNMTLFAGYDGKECTIFDIKDFENEIDMRLTVIDHLLSVTADDLFAHNLEYDLNNIFGVKFYHELELYYSGRLIFARWRNTEKLFLDSFNLSFASLAVVGDIVGLKKIEVNGQFYNQEYVGRDAEIVFHYVNRFRKSIKKDFQMNAGFTLAGTSQKLFLTKYDEFFLGGKNVNLKMLNAYYGGRCEAFFIGEVENVWEIDVNSMYPFVMSNCVFPTGEGFESVEPVTDFFITKVKVKVFDTVQFPILAYRTDKLFFPVGEFETWVTSVELKKAFEENQIESIEYLESFNFTERGKPFSEFVNDFYSKRKKAKDEGDEFNSNLYKLILNSCYGRFCLHKGMNVISGIDNGNEKFELKEVLNDTLALFDYKIESDKNKNYAVGLHVTAYARLQLFDIIKTVFASGFIPLYCDTDSCYFTIKESETREKIEETIKKVFPISNDLGDLSCEFYPKATFINAKVYILEKEDSTKKIKTKGIPKKHRSDFIENGIVTYKRPMKLRPALRGNKGVEENMWYDFTVERSGVYTKREVLEDGSTKPIKIQEWVSINTDLKIPI
jgi:hypothetical protein